MLWMKYGSSFFILRVHKFFKKISTHLLTVLIVNVIVQLEQRKRGKKKELLRNPESWMFQITTHQIFQTNISYVLNNIYKVLEGDMTYDDA